MENLAEHAFKMNVEMNDILIKNLRLTPIECDELWTFVKKRKLTPSAQIALKNVMHGSTLQ
ncbi:MAG: hypothetical protein QXZ12_08370 [Thermoplasmata archaeon]